MNIYQFMGEHPLLTFLMLYSILYCLFLCWNRLMRCLSIRANGWPPPHCDADGDFAKANKDES